MDHSQRYRYLAVICASCLPLASPASQDVDPSSNAEQMEIRRSKELKYTIKLEAPAHRVYCKAKVSVEYTQYDTDAGVTGKIENEDCAASYGEYTVAVRYRKNDEVFDDEYPGSWERTGDQPYLFEGRYPIGENADLVRVRARKIQCICGERAVDDADPVDEGEPE